MTVPLDNLIEMSKQVAEPILWANRMLLICLLMSILVGTLGTLLRCGVWPYTDGDG